jgi:hypothetical protein
VFDEWRLTLQLWCMIAQHWCIIYFIGHQSCFFVLNVAKLLLVTLKFTTVVLRLPIAVGELLPVL